MALDDWKADARASQQHFSNLLGDRSWDRFQIPQDEQLLWDKIAFALYGPPTDEGTNQGYQVDQIEKISELRDKCIQYCTKGKDRDVYLAFIFVYAFKDDVQLACPLMRLMKGDGKVMADSYFIDKYGRVYQNWQGFLDDNRLDGFWICVPRDGQYPIGDDVVVDYINQTERGKILSELDSVSTGTNVVTSVFMTAGLILAMFPPTCFLGGPIIAVSTIVGFPGSAYATIRGVSKLVDRSQHDQSISLTDPEAREYWLNSATALLSVGQMATTEVLTSAAELGGVTNTGFRAVSTALNVTSVTVSGFGVFNSFYVVSQKDEVTALDVFQLTSAIFFFTHAAVNTKTASGIIKDAQRKTIAAERKSLSTEHQEVFDKFQQGHKETVEPGKVHEMHGNAEFIRNIKVIKDKGEFFSMFKITSDDLLNVNNELVIDTKALLQMEKGERLIILELSKKLADNDITAKNFDMDMRAIGQKYRITFERKRAQAQANICKILKLRTLKDMRVGEHSIFNDIKPHEIDRLDQVFTQSCKKYNPDCVKVGCKMAELMKCKNVSEFTAVVEYVIRQLDVDIKSLRHLNPNPKRRGNTKAKDYYIEKVYGDFLKDVPQQEAMKNKFTKLMRNYPKENYDRKPRFEGPFSAANHYDKHAFFPEVDPINNLTQERYFEIAREMTNEPMTDAKWTQDGISRYCQYRSKKYQAMAVRLDNLANGTSVIATLMHDDVPVGESKLYND